MKMWGFFLLKISKNTMLILKDSPQINDINDPDIIKLLTLRLSQLAPPFPHKMIILVSSSCVDGLHAFRNPHYSASMLN